jgi:hypothetical protein
MLDRGRLVCVEPLDPAVAQDSPEAFVETSHLGSELRRAGRQAPHRGNPGVWRIGTLEAPSGEAVEHQRERTIAAFRGSLGQ